MPAWLSYIAFSVVFVLAGTALFFFTLTRGALLMRGAFSGPTKDADHVYPIYSNMRLIKLVDFQPIIAAILLFQYDRLVSSITTGLRHMNLDGKNVLITSCAFGNVIPRVVTAAVESGARKVLVADIIQNELDHLKAVASLKEAEARASQQPGVELFVYSANAQTDKIKYYGDTVTYDRQGMPVQNIQDIKISDSGSLTINDDSFTMRPWDQLNTYSDGKTDSRDNFRNSAHARASETASNKR